MPSARMAPGSTKSASHAIRLAWSLVSVRRLSPASFGHPGAGGSLGFADPETEIGFGYVMNQMQMGLAADPRQGALIAAVRGCL